MGWTGDCCGILRLTESRMGVLREAVGMSVGWRGSVPTESVKVWPWYGMVSRQSWEDWDDMGERREGMYGSNTGRAEYEPWVDC